MNEFARLSDLPSMRDIRETWKPAGREEVREQQGCTPGRNGPVRIIVGNGIFQSPERHPAESLVTSGMSPRPDSQNIALIGKSLKPSARTSR